MNLKCNFTKKYLLHETCREFSFYNIDQNICPVHKPCSWFYNMSKVGKLDIHFHKD